MKQNGMAIRRWLSDNPMFFAVIIIYTVMALSIPYFFTGGNLLSILQQITIIGIAATGLTFVIISAGNDLSIGSNMTMSAITAIYTMVKLGETMPMNAAVVIGILAGMCVGALIGLVNGIMVARVGCNPFIITIVMSMLVEGIAIFLTKASSIRAPGEFSAISKGSVLGIPNLVVVLVIFYLVGHFILQKTTFGRKVYAVGANANAARLVGINVSNMSLTLYVICGMTGAFAGIIMASRVGAATQAMGGYLFLDVMSAVIIGGTSLFGGKGNMLGTFLGVMILGMISNGFNLIGVEYNQTLIVKGVVILVAIMIEFTKEKFDSRKRIEISQVFQSAVIKE